MFKLYNTAYQQLQRIVYGSWQNAERVFIQDNQEHKLTLNFNPLPHAPLMLEEEKNEITKKINREVRQMEGIKDSLITWSIGTKQNSNKRYDKLRISVVTDIDIAAAASGSNAHIQYHLATTFPSPINLECPYCKQQALYSSTSNFLYHGRDYGAVYFCTCKPDGVYVGCHHKTSTPLGALCDSGTRLLRAKCHSIFEPYWKALSANMLAKEQKAFKIQMFNNLAKLLKIEPSECNFSLFDDDLCRRTIKHIESGDMNQFLSVLQQAKLAFNK